MEDKNFRKYFFWASVVIIVIVTYILISEFTASLLSAFIFAYLVLPVQKRLSKKVNKRVSALIIETLRLSILD
jgi:predicted PurR-regulated permease PerM